MDNINIKNIPENERATQFPGGSEGALKQQQAQKQVQVEKYEDFLTVDDVMKEIGDHGQYIEGDMTLNLGQDVKITAGDIELKVQGRVEPYTRASLNIPENYAMELHVTNRGDMSGEIYARGVMKKKNEKSVAIKSGQINISAFKQSKSEESFNMSEGASSNYSSKIKDPDVVNLGGAGKKVKLNQTGTVVAKIKNAVIRY